jgi:hypothetical protein
MFTVLSNTRNSHLYAILALAITLVVILVFGVAPSIAAPRPAIIPATGSQSAYVEFLRGEKAIYANPVGLSDALSAYHHGEKTIYTKPIDFGNALSAWRFGEKASYTKADLSWPPRPDFWHLIEKNVAPASYRSPTDECFDVPLREVAQCRKESETPSQ